MSDLNKIIGQIFVPGKNGIAAEPGCPPVPAHWEQVEDGYDRVPVPPKGVFSIVRYHTYSVNSGQGGYIFSDFADPEVTTRSHWGRLTQTGGVIPRGYMYAYAYVLFNGYHYIVDYDNTGALYNIVAPPPVAVPRYKDVWVPYDPGIPSVEGRPPTAGQFQDDVNIGWNSGARSISALKGNA
jgi:hypothetical protein